MRGSQVSRRGNNVHGFVTISLAALILGSPVVGSAPPLGRVGLPQQVETRFDGEYGLWIGLGEDSLDVRWITHEVTAGFLAVTEGGETIGDYTTPAAMAHRVSMPMPPTGRIVLNYGGLGEEGGRHETVVDLRVDLERLPVTYAGVDSIFVLGDVHGGYDRLTELLENAGVIDERHHWSGGSSHLVFLGDLLDRGPDGTRLLWFLYGLEREAGLAGGRVDTLLGNHEIMVMTGDHRYVPMKERRLAQLHGLELTEMYHPRHALLYRWLTGKPAVLEIDHILFAHAGVSEAFRSYSPQSFDDSLATFIGEPMFESWSDPTVTVPPMDSVAAARRIDFFFADNSVFWYRDYVLGDARRDELARVLEAFDAQLHVVGHTTVPRIQPLYDGMLVAVDPEEAGSEMLLLARTENGYEQYRYQVDGQRERLTTPD